MNKDIFKLAFIGLTFFAVGTSWAQDPVTTEVDTSWKRGGMIGLNFNQVAFSNWAAGGENSVSGIALFNYFANYNNGTINWENSLDLAYGLSQNGKEDARKTDDKIDIASKFGHKIGTNWYYSALLGFKSQFTAGYNYPNDSVKISDFLSPAYVTLSLGMDYKPNDNFSFYISPIAGRLIIVNDQEMADGGAFGVDPAEYDAFGVKTKSGDKLRLELGALCKIEYKKDIMENVNLNAKFEFFSNYLEDPQNVDVNASVKLTMKVNSYINANIGAELIYDDNTTILVDSDNDGVIDAAGPRTQFKELIGVGISYKF
ncbi:MAG TPA: DUF3078 domain-containing protein [Bacteroidia bacterium]|nr:DUF3078 domain-containing protein [Bacteroidia bacterium]